MPSAVTCLLDAAVGGDEKAAAELLPLVYDQLRLLARKKMRQERSDETLQATALVHEAYIRLVGADAERGQRWQGRWHFFAAAAEAMRRILVDRARRRGRLKRGGALRRVDLDAAGAALALRDRPDELIALDEALAGLAEEHPLMSRLVKLRYFAGLTMDEVAEALGVSPSTADRNWVYARAWLYRRMGRPRTSH